MNTATNGTTDTTTAEYYLVGYYCNVTRRNYVQKIGAAGRNAQGAVDKCKHDNNETTLRVTSVTFVTETPETEWTNG